MELSETRRRWLTLVAIGLGGLMLGCCGGIGSLSVWDRLAAPAGRRAPAVGAVEQPRIYRSPEQMLDAMGQRIGAAKR